MLWVVWRVFLARALKGLSFCVDSEWQDNEKESAKVALLNKGSRQEQDPQIHKKTSLSSQCLSPGMARSRWKWQPRNRCQISVEAVLKRGRKENRNSFTLELPTYKRPWIGKQSCLPDKSTSTLSYHQQLCPSINPSIHHPFTDNYFVTYCSWC